MALFIVDFCDPSTGGGGGSGSNVTGFSYNIGTETATITTDQPAAYNTVWPIQFQNTIHVAPNGNNANALASTVSPYSLQVPFLTLDAAYAASSPQDLIMIWPGSYTMGSTFTIDGTKATRFYAHPGVGIITPTAGNPGFSISPGQTLEFKGSATFLARDYIFTPSSPATDINYVVFECDQIAQIGSSLFFGNISSMSGSIRVRKITDMALFCDGWCQIDFANDYSGFSGAASYNLGNISGNNGIVFNTTYGVSRFQMRGLSGLYAHVYAAINDGSSAFTSGFGGTRADRYVKIQADVYVFNGNGFNIAEGTWIWEGHGLLDRDVTLDQNPFFIFGADNTDFYFEHRGGGSVIALSDNTILLFSNNGDVKLSGKYRAPGETFSLFEYYESTSGNRLMLDCDMKVDLFFPAILFFFTGSVPMFLSFEKASIEMTSGSQFLLNNNGVPFGFRVNYSLITNTGYDNITNTDTSLGNRHYIDERFTNVVNAEMSVF